MDNALTQLFLRVSRQQDSSVTGLPATSSASPPPPAAAALARGPALPPPPQASSKAATTRLQRPGNHSAPPLASPGLLEATTQLRNAIPALKSFRLLSSSHASASASSSWLPSVQGNLMFHFAKFVQDQDHPLRRRPGSTELPAAAFRFVNLVGRGITHCALDPPFIMLALSNELNTQLRVAPPGAPASSSSFSTASSSCNGRRGVGALSQLTCNLPALRPESAGPADAGAGAASSSTFAAASSLSCSSSLSDVTAAAVSGVETLFLSNNRLLGSLVVLPPPTAPAWLSLTGTVGAAHQLLAELPLRSGADSPLLGLARFSRLTKLSLVSCGLRHVTQLSPLRFLPRLEHLMLEGNPLCDVLPNYRATVICYFSHCPCCCCYEIGGDDDGGGGGGGSNHNGNNAAESAQQGGDERHPHCFASRMMSFRCTKLSSLDGKHIVESERRRAVAETAPFLSTLRDLRALLQRLAMLRAVINQFALTDELRRRHYHHHNHHRVVDARSLQRRAFRVLVLFDALARSAALRSAIFDPSVICLLCGNSAADGLLLTLLSRTLQRLCVAVTRRSRAAQVSARLPTWRDAVERLREELSDGIEEAIVVLIQSHLSGDVSSTAFSSSFTSSPGDRNLGYESLGPLHVAVAVACRSWPSHQSPELSNTDTTNQRHHHHYHHHRYHASFVCSLPIVLNDDNLRAAERSLLHRAGASIDVSLFDRDATVADVSAIYRPTAEQPHHRFRCVDGDDDPFAADAVALLQQQQDEDGRSPPSAQLLMVRDDEEEADYGDGDERQSDAVTTVAAAADDFFTSGLRQRCLVRWSHRALHRQQRRDRSVAVVEQLVRFDLKRRAFARWRLRSLEAQYRWIDRRHALMRCFYFWQERARLSVKWHGGGGGGGRTSSSLRSAAAATARHDAVAMRPPLGPSSSTTASASSSSFAHNSSSSYSSSSDLADEFYRASLLFGAFTRWRRKQQHILVDSLCDAFSASTTRGQKFKLMRLLAASGAPSGRRDERRGGGSSIVNVAAIERLRHNDAVRAAVLELWRSRLERRLQKQQQQQQLLQEQQQFEMQQLLADLEQETETEEHLSAARRILRGGRRQLWRSFARALKSQRVLREVQQFSARRQARLLDRSDDNSNSNNDNDNNNALHASSLEEEQESIIDVASQVLDESLELSDLSPSLSPPRTPSRPPHPLPPASCDVSAIEVVTTHNDSGSLRLLHAGAASADQLNQQQQRRRRNRLKNLRVVESFHRLAESMSKFPNV